MFVSLVVVILYFLPYFFGHATENGLVIIGWTSLLLSGGTFLASFIAYLWAPQKYINPFAFLVYTLLVVTTANLVMNTGEINSPFIALWIAVAVFAGVFGGVGYLLLGFGAIAYMVYAGLSHAPMVAFVLAALAGLAPLIGSFIIWHTKSPRENTRDKAYNQLASELNQESSKADVVINAINDGVVAVDKRGVIELINPAAQHMIGWGREDAVNLSYKSVIKLHDRADKPVSQQNDPIEQVLMNNQEVHSEDFSIHTEGGKKVLLSIIVSPIGRPSTGAIIVFRDMTKEKAEEREQAEFISTASHEMRTPVASIEGYLGLVLNPATAQIDDKAREYVTKAQASAQHLGRLFQDLLDVSRADDGRITNNPSVVDVVEFVADVAEGLRVKAQEKGLRFIFKPRTDTGASGDRLVTPVYYTHVDNDHLREVVSNLIENAIKYTLKGDVIIDVGGDETHVNVSIQDSGIGIPAEDIPHLFQKFYRVDNTDTREIGGTGLGLYLSRRLAELMGGRITVQSEYKKGSTFMLALPRIDQEEANRLIEAATAAATVADEPIHAVSAISLEQSPQAQSETAQPAYETSIVAAVPQPNNNIPIATIEQNPSAYTSRPRTIKVPVRDPDTSNQP